MSRANLPAFPTEWSAVAPTTGAGFMSGLTIREHFAAMALTGLCNESHGEAYTPEGAATRAVRMADALLAELAKAQP